MTSIYEEMSSEQKKKAKKLMGQLTQNPIAKSSGAGALSPEAAEQLGDKAKELRKKKLSQIGLPSIKKKGLDEAHWNPVTKKVEDKRASREEIESLAAKARTKKKVRKPLGSIRKNSATFTPSSPEQAKADKASWNAYWEGSWKNKEQKEGYIPEEKGMSRKDAYEVLQNHKYSKRELWEMQKKATKEGDHGMAAGIFDRWKEMKEETISEREMSSSEMKKEKKLKKKYDTSGMKKSMIGQYGKEKGTQIYFATIRKQAMQDSFDYDDAYAYIIEMLVAADFAEDYDAAEVMFEHISDEFTSAILEEYIEEKARGTRKKTTVHAYDVDETLFGHGKKGKPNVQVHVKDSSGKRVKSLSNQEFNTHKLDKGHSYDFSEFQSAKKFKETSSPNKKVIKDIKRKQARGQNVHLITARSKFDKPGEFQGHLKKHGVDVDKSKIHYTGGMKGGDIGKKKVDVANAVAKQSGAKKIHMYDDAAKVHKAFEKEKKEAPTSKKIKTHMVAPDKKGEARVRSYQATKNEEMTAYEYWKQFINEENDSEVISEVSYAAQKELNALKRIPSNLAQRAGRALKPNTLMRRELGNLGRASRGLGVRATPFLGVDTVLNTRAQERGAADFQRRSGGVRPGELYRASDVNSKGVAKPGAKMQLGAIEAAARGKTATKDSKSALKPQAPSAPAKPLERKVISDKGGTNQKVSTNTAYKAKLGGREVTSTRGSGGQKMIRANLGNNSVQVAKGKAQAGKSYGATLGGVKGTVKYDAKGGKTFQALQKPAAPKAK